MPIDFEQDRTPISDADLMTINELANEQLVLEAKIAGLETELSETKEKHRRIEQDVLPQKMMELGLLSFTLASGESINIKEVYFGSIPRDSAEEAFIWLKDNGHEDLIKNEVIAKFAKGEDEIADLLVKFLDQGNFTYDRKQAVHSSTLKAFVKDLCESGQTVPACLGVHKVNKAIIKKGK